MRSTIQFAPGGKHHVHPCNRADPINVFVGQAACTHIANQLKKANLRASLGECSRLFLDFDHEEKEAAGYPIAFYWNDGIMLEVEWTEAGRKAIEGGMYQYFSPVFVHDLDHESIIGIPDHGSIGALVNTPAFQTIDQVSIMSYSGPRPGTVVNQKGITSTPGVSIPGSSGNNGRFTDQTTMITRAELAQFIGCNSNTLTALDSAGMLSSLSSQRICGKQMYQLAGVESCLERIYREYPKMNPFAGAGNITNQCVLTYRFPTLAAKLKLSTSK